MRLREIKYQMSVKLKSLLPVFHKSHYENLIWMVVGMVYSRSVTLPRVAESAPISQIQLESRVQRFERLRRCAKLDPLEVFKPVATRVLAYLSRFGPLMILMDRTLINDTLNLLYVAVSFGGRAWPLGSRGGATPGQFQPGVATTVAWLGEPVPAGGGGGLHRGRSRVPLHPSGPLDSHPDESPFCAADQSRDLGAN